MQTLIQTNEHHTESNVFKGIDFTLRVSDESMTPRYERGDLLMCKTINEITFVQWARVHVIKTPNFIITLTNCIRKAHKS